MCASGRNSFKRGMQCAWRGFGEQAMVMQQAADCAHSLAATADNTARPACGPPLRTFGLSCLVYKRCVEATNASADNPPGTRAVFDNTPAARGDAKVNSQYAFGHETPPMNIYSTTLD